MPVSVNVPAVLRHAAAAADRAADGQRVGGAGYWKTAAVSSASGAAIGMVAGRVRHRHRAAPPLRSKVPPLPDVSV